MKPFERHPSARYLWAFAILSSSAALGFTLLFLQILILREILDVSVEIRAAAQLGTAFLVALFGFVATRYVYVHGHQWPITTIKLVWPLALFGLFVPTLVTGAGAVFSGINLLLWFAAYKLLKRLAELSPKANG